MLVWMTGQERSVLGILNSFPVNEHCIYIDAVIMMVPLIFKNQVNHSICK